MASMMSGELGRSMPAISRVPSLIAATAACELPKVSLVIEISFDRLRDLQPATLQKLEQILVDAIRMRRREAMRQARVIDFRGSLDQLRGLFPRVLDRHDLIVFTVHDQGRDVDLLEIFAEVRFREGLDALVRVLEAGLHAPH